MNKKVLRSMPFGPIEIIWSSFSNTPKIIRVLLSTPTSSAEDQASRLYPHVPASSCTEIDAVASAITRLLNGEPVAIPLDVADLDQCSSFQQAVLRAEYQIPRGSVSTYRLIAEHIGRPNGARAVGTALARNPFPLIVPCHRALRSDGHLGGYQGGLTMKRTLLEKEGLLFDGAGRVVCERLHYERTANEDMRAKAG